MRRVQEPAPAHDAVDGQNPADDGGRIGLDGQDQEEARREDRPEHMPGRWPRDPQHILGLGVQRAGDQGLALAPGRARQEVAARRHLFGQPLLLPQGIEALHHRDRPHRIEAAGQPFQARAAMDIPGLTRTEGSVVAGHVDDPQQDRQAEHEGA
ncbi:hypothetical protein D3C80_1275720 [compost metagenome]